MSTNISKTTALEYINNYRNGLPPGSMKSAWLNRDFIDAILTLSSTHQLSGVRVYLAKYTEDDPDGLFVKDKDTVILVPTENGPDGDKDVDSAYYDYSQICPPHCPTDEGN